MDQAEGRCFQGGKDDFMLLGRIQQSATEAGNVPLSNPP